MNLALKLTVFRIILVPLYLVIYFLPFTGSNWVAWTIYSIASVTDFFDGYIARKYNQSSKLGALLDPVADKILISVVLISILTKHSEGFLGLYLMLCSVIIIGRELIISALREFMAGLGIRSAVAVQSLGKYKTMVQIFALGFLIVYEKTWWIPTYQIGYTLLGVATVMAIWSMIGYLKSAGQALKKNDIDLYR